MRHFITLEKIVRKKKIVMMKLMTLLIFCLMRSSRIHIAWKCFLVLEKNRLNISGSLVQLLLKILMPFESLEMYEKLFIIIIIIIVLGICMI